jgi:hypothetical protein
MQDAIKKAKKAGATAETIIRIAGKEMTLGEAVVKAGMTVEDVFGNKSKELIEFVKSMYNSDEGNFPKGETGVLIACEKKFGEGVMPMAQKVVEKLTSLGETTRMKKLAGMEGKNIPEQAPGMMDPQAMMKQQMDALMKNPAFQKLDPNTMMQKLQQNKLAAKTNLAKMPPGTDNYTVNGKSVSKAEYDAFMAKNPQLAQNMQNPANVVQGNPELGRIKKMAGMPTDDDW